MFGFSECPTSDSVLATWGFLLSFLFLSFPFSLFASRSLNGGKVKKLRIDSKMFFSCFLRLGIPYFWLFSFLSFLCGGGLCAHFLKKSPLIAHTISLFRKNMCIRYCYRFCFLLPFCVLVLSFLVVSSLFCLFFRYAYFYFEISPKVII